MLICGTTWTLEYFTHTHCVMTHMSHPLNPRIYLQICDKKKKEKIITNSRRTAHDIRSCSMLIFIECIELLVKCSTPLRQSSWHTLKTHTHSAVDKCEFEFDKKSICEDAHSFAHLAHKHMQASPVTYWNCTIDSKLLGWFFNNKKNGMHNEKISSFA